MGETGALIEMPVAFRSGQAPSQGRLGWREYLDGFNRRWFEMNLRL